MVVVVRRVVGVVGCVVDVTTCASVVVVVGGTVTGGGVVVVTGVGGSVVGCGQGMSAPRGSPFSKQSPSWSALAEGANATIASVSNAAVIAVLHTLIAMIPLYIRSTGTYEVPPELRHRTTLRIGLLHIGPYIGVD